MGGNSTQTITHLYAAVIPILFYRSMLLAADVAPIDLFLTSSAGAAWHPCRSSSPASRTRLHSPLSRTPLLP